MENKEKMVIGFCIACIAFTSFTAGYCLANSGNLVMPIDQYTERVQAK